SIGPGWGSGRYGQPRGRPENARPPPFRPRAGGAGVQARKRAGMHAYHEPPAPPPPKPPPPNPPKPPPLKPPPDHPPPPPPLQPPGMKMTPGPPRRRRWPPPPPPSECRPARLSATSTTMKRITNTSTPLGPSPSAARDRKSRGEGKRRE